MDVARARQAPPAPAADNASVGLTAAAVGMGAVLALVIFMVLGDAVPTQPAPGLPGAGLLVGWLLPVSRLALDLAAVATVGCLLYAGYLIPARDRALRRPAQMALRTGSWCALAWSVSAAVAALLSLADISGMPLTELIGSDGFVDSLVSVDQSRSLLLVAALAALVCLATRRVSTPEGPLLVLVLAAGTLVPPILTGHAASHNNHELATVSLIVHVLAASAWVGGLGALLAFRRKSTKEIGTVTRFSTLALACFLATGISGLVNAWIRLGDGDGVLTELLHSRYGLLVLGKLAALAALAGFGWWHRRRTLVQLAAARPGAFRRFAGREVLVMIGTIALAVALSRTPTPGPAGSGIDPNDPTHSHALSITR